MPFMRPCRRCYYDNVLPRHWCGNCDKKGWDKNMPKQTEGCPECGNTKDIVKHWKDGYLMYKCPKCNTNLKRKEGVWQVVEEQRTLDKYLTGR